MNMVLSNCRKHSFVAVNGIGGEEWSATSGNDLEALVGPSHTICKGHHEKPAFVGRSDRKCGALQPSGA